MTGTRPHREDSWLNAQTRRAVLTRVGVVMLVAFVIALPFVFLCCWKVAHESVVVSLGIALVTLGVSLAAVVRGVRRILARYPN